MKEIIRSLFRGSQSSHEPVHLPESTPIFPNTLQKHVLGEYTEVAPNTGQYFAPMIPKEGSWDTIFQEENGDDTSDLP